MLAPFPVERVRDQFPGLLPRDTQRAPAVFFDGPAGSQVPRRVADAVAHTLLHCNANTGGAFALSRAVNDAQRQARSAAADFVGSDDPETVVFGANMTALTFLLSRLLARTWKPGDEVVLTRLDHDANVTPWVRAAASAGASVRFVEITPGGELDHDSLARALTPRTRLLAFTAAANLIGSLVDVRELVVRARGVGALTFVDAVHFAAHRRVDVTRWGCDLLACSAYKFFGPHVGILWGRRSLLESLDVEKVRPAKNVIPWRLMQGTPNHEGIVGVGAAIDYLADLGRSLGPANAPRPAALTAAFDAIVAHETALCARLLRGLRAIDGVRILGVADPARADARAPTVAFTHARRRADEIATALAEVDVHVWAGHSYAVELAQALALDDTGAVRVGLLHYNTADEVDRFLAALREIVA